MSRIVYVNQKDVAAREIYPGVRKRVLWQGANGAKAQILEIDAGAKFLKRRSPPRPRGSLCRVGNVQRRRAITRPGRFVHNPAGSSHLPQSKEGCGLFVFFPEGPLPYAFVIALAQWPQVISGTLN